MEPWWKCTSSDPINETLPSSLKEDEGSGDLDATAKPYCVLGLLFARGGKRSCTDVGTEMTPVSILHVLAAKYIAVGRNDLDDVLKTKEQLSKRYKNVEGGVDRKDEDLKTSLETCMARLFWIKIEEMMKLQERVTKKEASSERAEKRSRAVTFTGACSWSR